MDGSDVFRFDDTERQLLFHPVANDTPATLTTEQISAFNRDGFVSPLPCLTPEAATALRAYMDGLIEQVVSADDRRNAYSINNYHTVCQGLWDLVVHPVIVRYVTDILGPKAVCWSTHAFCKLPGDGMEVPLHQDANYWPFTPTQSVTVWLAVDDVDAGNAAMRFVPGSHLSGGLPHDELELDGRRRAESPGGRPPEDFDRHRSPTSWSPARSRCTPIFCSTARRLNVSDRRRCGITLRYVAAEVRAVAAGESWIRGAVQVGDGDPSGYWPNRGRPEGEDPDRMARFVGGFDGNR